MVNEHCQLKGTSKSAAISQFLYIVSATPRYGMEPYTVKLVQSASTADLSTYNSTPIDVRSSHVTTTKPTLEDIKFCIGPRGIEIVDLETQERKM